MGKRDGGRLIIRRGQIGVSILSFGLLRGDRPTLETIFEVSLVGDDRRFKVRAGRAVCG
jgi:hypothetical protein